jgi:hypothetical protein
MKTAFDQKMHSAALGASPNGEMQLQYGYSRSGVFRIRLVVDHGSYTEVAALNTEIVHSSLSTISSREDLFRHFKFSNPRQDKFMIGRFKGDLSGEILNLDICGGLSENDCSLKNELQRQTIIGHFNKFLGEHTKGLLNNSIVELPEYPSVIIPSRLRQLEPNAFVLFHPSDEPNACLMIGRSHGLCGLRFYRSLQGLRGNVSTSRSVPSETAVLLDGLVSEVADDPASHHPNALLFKIRLNLARAGNDPIGLFSDFIRNQFAALPIDKFSVCHAKKIDCPSVELEFPRDLKMPQISLSEVRVD